MIKSRQKREKNRKEVNLNNKLRLMTPTTDIFQTF